MPSICEPTAHIGAARGTNGRHAVIATLSRDIASPPESVYAVLIDQDTWAALDPPCWKHAARSRRQCHGCLWPILAAVCAWNVRARCPEFGASVAPTSLGGCGLGFYP